MLAFSVVASLSVRQQWAEETSAMLVEKMANIHEATRRYL